MKKSLIFLYMAIVALVSCGKENPVSEDSAEQPAAISFNLAANHPNSTRAVKSGWEKGDAIFVFFTGVESPKHLKMTFDGNSWTSVEYDGAAIIPGALGLKNGDQGKMRAVFLPFGSDATVLADGASFKFSTTYYAYYLTATLSYTVTDNMVSGSFDMQIPKDYVQFFIEDAAPDDGAYSLGTDAVIPTGIASISSSGSINETKDKSASDDMTGYAYKNGYLFSGKLNSLYLATRVVDNKQVDAHAYYFAKTRTMDGSRVDYFVSDKPLESHSAIKLPANDDSKWQVVGRDVFYELLPLDLGSLEESETSLGKWYTCNYQCTLPEQVGPLCSIDEALELEGLNLPTRELLDRITVKGRADWIRISVHGRVGILIKALNAFLFLPLYSEYGTGAYWSSTYNCTLTEPSGVCYDAIHFNSMGGFHIGYDSHTAQHALRSVLD